MLQPDLLTCGDMIIVALPAHTPRGREQQKTRPAVIVGIVPVYVVKYSQTTTPEFKQHLFYRAHDRTKVLCALDVLPDTPYPSTTPLVDLGLLLI